MRIIIREFETAIENYRIWRYLSFADIKNRFRRSKLGILWPIFNQLAFSLGAGLIWAAVFGLDPSEFIPFLTIGFAIWGFLSGSMIEGCSSFVIAHGYLKQLPLPQTIFLLRTFLTQLIYFLIGLVTAVCILLVFGFFNPIGIILAIPGLILLCIFCYSAIGSLAYLGLRYRDLPHGLSSLLSMLFVVTPVIYPSEVMIERGFEFAVYFNPFASFIDIVRYPIIYSEFASVEQYSLASLIVVCGLGLRFFLQWKWERYVAFWS